MCNEAKQLVDAHVCYSRKHTQNAANIHMCACSHTPTNTHKRTHFGESFAYSANESEACVHVCARVSKCLRAWVGAIL